MYEDEDIFQQKNIPSMFFTGIYIIISIWLTLTGLYIGFHTKPNPIFILPILLFIYNLPMVAINKTVEKWIICYGNEKNNRIAAISFTVMAISMQAALFENFRSLSRNSAYSVSGNYWLINLFITQLFIQTILTMVPATFLTQSKRWKQRKEAAVALLLHGYLLIMIILEFLTELTLQGVAFAPKAHIAPDIGSWVFCIFGLQFLLFIFIPIFNFGGEKFIKLTNIATIMCFITVLVIALLQNLRINSDFYPLINNNLR